jgi:hypothetical protein
MVKPPVNGRLPFPPYNLTDEETFTVKVFRDHPEWDRCERWWKMPSNLLRELFVDVYECQTQGHLDWLNDTHPGCVFVY